MRHMQIFTFILAIGTAVLVSFGQEQPPNQPKPPPTGVPKTPPKSPQPGTPGTPKPIAPGPAAPKPRTGPEATPPTSPKPGPSETPRVPPRTPEATPKSPRPGSPDATTPKVPRTPDVTPPRSPRANDPDAGSPKTPPRGTTPPDRRPLDPPGRSTETRKPVLPDTDRTPGRPGLDPAPRPDPSDRTTPRLDRRPDTTRPETTRPGATRPETTRPRDNVPERPGTPPSRRPDPADRTTPPDRTTPDRTTPDRTTPDRTTPPDRTRDIDRTRDADRTRDTDREDIPSGFTRAPDRNARDAADRPVKQLRVDPRTLRNDPAVSAVIKNLQNVRSADQLDRAFSELRDDRRDGRLAALNLDRVSGRFQARIRSNEFNTLIQSRIGQRFDLDRQFNLFVHGDVARQLNLSVNLVDHGGWRARHVGPIFSGYTRFAFSSWYPGPHWYPAYTWMPRWSPWVQWSFWTTVLPIYDPRPFVVRPIIYEAAPIVTIYEYPVWQELPIVTSGTWVEVPPVSVPSGQDLQLLAVRFVDPGHVEEDLGPRYRVWLRNNARDTLDRSFDVTAFASVDKELSDQVVQAGVTIPEIAGEDTIAVDIRLPADANRLVEDNNVRVPFNYLQVVVDSRNATKEHDEENNGAVLKRGDILPVDPAAFSTDVTAAAPGSTITIAGEGFGPEPGEVIVSIGEEQHPTTVRGWYDLGVQIEVPDLDLREQADAQVLVVRGDGAASNPVPLSIAPEESIGMLEPAPAPER